MSRKKTGAFFFLSRSRIEPEYTMIEVSYFVNGKLRNSEMINFFSGDEI